MKVFAYLRVSTREQIEGGGYDRQLGTIDRFTSVRDWVISRTFKDQQSGGTEFEGRDGLHELLSLAGANTALGIDTIVVENASRIARDLIVQELFLAECRRRGIKVFTADNGEEIVMANADPSRVLMRQIFGALAQWEKAQTVLKLQAGRRKRARETGQPCGGPKPYGQTESELAVIADIWKYRKLDWTFLKIACKLRDTGYPAPKGRGNFWAASTVELLFKREQNRRAAQQQLAATVDNDQ
jgi:DNA invertase Pin-like site-specific DNA recombinase